MQKVAVAGCGSGCGSVTLRQCGNTAVWQWQGGSRLDAAQYGGHFGTEYVNPGCELTAIASNPCKCGSGSGSMAVAAWQLNKIISNSSVSLKKSDKQSSKIIVAVVAMWQWQLWQCGSGSVAVNGNVAVVWQWH
jgi:hypothetical protein